jgi:predicted enzyme related to lactoylglutathione lyase
MEPFNTPGAVSWTELMTPDPEPAKAFYGRLFGWQFETMDMGQGPYHVVKVGDASIGGIGKPPPEAQGMPPMWGSYVTVANCDETADLCVQLGGKVLFGPMDIPNVGRFALLQDPQGATLSAIAYGAPSS